MDHLLDGPSRQALVAASRAAGKLDHPQVGAVHLLAGVLHGDGPAARVMAGFGLTAAKAHAFLTTHPAPASPDSAARVREPLAGALRSTYATAVRDNGRVSPTHLTRAALTCGDPSVHALLTGAHTDAQTILAALDALDPDPSTPPATVPGPSGAPHPGLPEDLTRFGYDLVVRAAAGDLPPVHGRDRELDRVQTVLARRSKNNPVLVGEAGVGKTAIVEGLAHLIATGRCVPALRDRPLIVLDVAALVAGARARGDFEGRLKKALAAAERIGALLFIDEIHQIVGAGAGSGSLDVANLLKEKLARGAVTLIGATTLDEYRRHVEADPALERRLERVRVEPATVEATIDILRAVRATFATHHRVRYTDAALRAAAVLTDRHVRDRHLPDKAIDALDEAGAAAAMAVMRGPAALSAMYAERATVRDAISAAVAVEDYEQAADLTATDRQLTAHITAAGPDLAVVDEAAVARIVAATSGVPVGAVSVGEHDALRTLPDRVGARVIGQAHAVAAVCAAVRRRRVLGASRPTSFVFAGPTGVGKTELATVLARELFTTEGALLRFDMSEYAEKHTVARLIGAPPGYAGYDEGGQLTEAVHRSPHAVVLLDEVEKAHPDVFDLLLQVLEDGHLTDSAGRTVSFADTIVILTTNLGSTAATRAPVGFAGGGAHDVTAAARTRVKDAVKAHFRPELVNRFDDVIVFDALTRTDLTAIVGNLLERPLCQLADKGVRITLTDAALDLLLTRGYDPAMGARPLRRVITQMLENPLSDALLAGALPPGSHALVDAVDGRAELVVVPEPALADTRAPATACT